MGKFGEIVKVRRQDSGVSTTQKSESPEIQQRGRPRAKRSSPDYRQVTAYIRKDTYRAVKTVLLTEEREFSELVESLLNDYLKLRTQKPE
jgi:hypothetical protein